MTKNLRLGIIGVGGMGGAHARSILNGNIPRCTLSAVCDSRPETIAAFPQARPFTDSEAMFRSGEIDAVLIATPHYSHTTLGIQALEAGLHVLVEKPISVHKADCERLIAAHRSPRQVFAAMFNMRSDAAFIKLRHLIQSGELGVIRRAQWTVTHWFRTQAYYALGRWRATWAGEGGGVLLNQCPHQLDLWQWLFGMPRRVRAFCHFGRYHDIEVEDDVSAYLEYDNGMTGLFVTSTGEAPGTNRLEIAAERGRVIFENGKITFTRNEVPMSEFCRTSPGIMAPPPVWNVEIPFTPGGSQHAAILRNFTDAVLDGVPLIAPAEEGIHSVELANAMILSTFEERTIHLPLDGTRYEAALRERSERSSATPRLQAVL